MPDDAVVYSDDSPLDEPRTHVLLVGVGHYPNFARGVRGGGPAPLADLGSPPISVRALADWFITEYNYPPAPIGTVALLISEGPPATYTAPNGKKWPVPVPTYERFDAKANLWLDRGDRNEDSRLIFLFCGHGYGYGYETSLLMADFDFTMGNPWDRALDLGTFHAGTEKYKAAEQMFFIDACRRPHGDLVQPGAAIGRSPAAPAENPRSGFQRKRKPLLIFSTGQNEPARSRTGDLSVFTHGFLRAVKGMGARNDTGPWKVGTLAMLEAIDHVSHRLTDEDFPDPQQPQGADARSLELHHLRGEPVSPVYVGRSGNPLGPAELRYRLKGKRQKRPCGGDENEVDLWLPPGNYNLELVDGETVLARARKAPSGPVFKTVVLQP